MTIDSNATPKWEEFETNSRGFFEAWLWDDKLPRVLTSTQYEYHVIPPLDEGY